MVYTDSSLREVLFQNFIECLLIISMQLARFKQNGNSNPISHTETTHSIPILKPCLTH